MEPSIFFYAAIPAGLLRGAQGAPGNRSPDDRYKHLGKATAIPVTVFRHTSVKGRVALSGPSLPEVMLTRIVRNCKTQC
jgi:hypothetical protein